MPSPTLQGRALDGEKKKNQFKKYLTYLNITCSSSVRLKTTALPAVKRGKKNPRKSLKTADQMKGEKDEGGFKSALERMCVTASTCCGEGEKRKQGSRDQKSDLL